jgi:hypothetical protein
MQKMINLETEFVNTEWVCGIYILAIWGRLFKAELANLA